MNTCTLNQASARNHWPSRIGVTVLVMTFAGCASWDVNDPRLGQSLAAAKQAQRSFKRDGSRDVITSKELKAASDRYLGGEDSLASKEDVKSLIKR